MDVAAELLGEHSKRQISRLVAWVGGDPQRFARFVAHMTGPDRRLAQRAAWVVGDSAEAWPELAAPHLPRLLDHLETPGLHDAVVRHVFRLLQFVPLAPALEGRVLGLALAALGGAAPIAVKAYALTVLKQLSTRYPEILPEVHAVIDELGPTASPGIRSRIRREFGRWTDL